MESRVTLSPTAMQDQFIQRKRAVIQPCLLAPAQESLSQADSLCVQWLGMRDIGQIRL